MRFGSSLVRRSMTASVTQTKASVRYAGTAAGWAGHSRSASSAHSTPMTASSGSAPGTGERPQWRRASTRAADPKGRPSSPASSAGRVANMTGSYPMWLLSLRAVRFVLNGGHVTTRHQYRNDSPSRSRDGALPPERSPRRSAGSPPAGFRRRCPTGRFLVAAAHRNCRAALVAAEALDDLRVDVVHDHCLAGPLTAARRRVPTVLTAHGPLDGEVRRYYELLADTLS